MLKKNEYMKTLELKRNDLISSTKNLIITNKVVKMNNIINKWQRENTHKSKMRGLLKKNISIDFNNKGIANLSLNKTSMLPRIDVVVNKRHNVSLMSTKKGQLSKCAIEISDSQPESPLKLEIKEQYMNQIEEKFYIDKSKSINKLVTTTKTKHYLINVH